MARVELVRVDRSGQRVRATQSAMPEVPQFEAIGLMREDAGHRAVEPLAMYAYAPLVTRWSPVKRVD